MSTIISYRSRSAHSAKFLNVDKLLQEENAKKLEKKYRNIFSSVTAYEPQHANSFRRVEGDLYQRIANLHLQKQQILEEKKEKISFTKWTEIVLSAVTLGGRPLFLLIKKCRIENKLEKIKNKISENYEAHRKFERSLAQMDQRQLEKNLHKSEAIAELEALQLDDLDKELARLESNPRIAQAFTRLQFASKNHQAALGRSLELQEQLQDTHYVINHGQNLELMLVNVIARKLKREFEPNQYDSFEPLRHDTSLRHIVEEEHTVEWYQNQMVRGNNDHNFRKELICGDYFLESESQAESALYFFSGGLNIAVYESPRNDLTSNLLLPIIQDYVMDPQVAQKLCSDLIKIMKNCPKGGNLYSICVPKEKFDESCYFSGPFGYPYPGSWKDKIEEVQAGIHVPKKEPFLGFIGYEEVIPQIRILSHKIRPEDGYHVVLNSTLTQEQLQNIDHEVSVCLQAALTRYRIKAKPKDVFKEKIA